MIDNRSALKANSKLEQILAYARGVNRASGDSFLLDLVTDYMTYNRDYMKTVQEALEKKQPDEDFKD